MEDKKAREMALDWTQSFIVEAPAGSGKTELLTKRYLALLGKACHYPEEIVAITFTRKAAAEMRTRIMTSLQSAMSPPPDEAHKKEIWELANQVREQDLQHGWGLALNPNRLRIFTIDALCANLSRRVPITAELNPERDIIDDATPLYIKASQDLILSLSEDPAWKSALTTLLLHLDNNIAYVERLCVEMLKCRDQWLPHIFSKKDEVHARKNLENALRSIIQEALKDVLSAFSQTEKEKLLPLLRFSAYQLNQLDIHSPITEFNRINNFPKDDLSDLPGWLAIKELLLTKSDEWRKSVNKNIGFPSAASAMSKSEKITFSEMKEKMCAFLDSIKLNAPMLSALQALSTLPTDQYNENEWEVLSALLELLPLLVAYFELSCQAHQKTDFISITQSANQALGTSDEPSELALNLDYKIAHLLIDEFQDTSRTHFALITQLIEGWQKADGRTLFLVGDPKQSIYRFREADVSLFLKVKTHGIGNLRPTPLALTLNFRSTPEIVNWINDTFSPIFPAKENMSLGAISYHPSTAYKAEKISSQVQCFALAESDTHDEAELVLSLLETEFKKDRTQSIAILVRSRTHLLHLIPTLKNANIAFQAHDIDPLFSSLVVQDLFSLTKAFLHLHDRIAWLSILRAPFCGLTLNDLYALSEYAPSKPIYFALIHFHEIDTLSQDGFLRLSRIVPILQNAIEQRDKTRFNSQVKLAWYALGGPACLESPQEIKNARDYLRLLSTHANQAAFSLDAFEQKLYGAFVQSQTESSNVHILTIHKAKGLEFDTVILPGLNKKAGYDRDPLLMWLTRTNANGIDDIILSPIKRSDEDQNAISRYIRSVNYAKSKLEMTRLFYVAATRAKKSLYLLGELAFDEETGEFKSPSSQSFMGLIWPVRGDDFLNHFISASSKSEAEKPEKLLTRLTSDWTQPHPIATAIQGEMPHTPIVFSWQVEIERITGIILHEWLYTLSQTPLPDWEMILKKSPPLIRRRLLELSGEKRSLDNEAHAILTTLIAVSQDKRATWILSPHPEARSEFALSMLYNGSVRRLVIDRTFLSENQTRWIIDYKTSLPPQTKSANFYEAMQDLHKAQLEQYALALKAMYPSDPIRLGLYFPRFQGWCDWEYG